MSFTLHQDRTAADQNPIYGRGSSIAPRFSSHRPYSVQLPVPKAENNDPTTKAGTDTMTPEPSLHTVRRPRLRDICPVAQHACLAESYLSIHKALTGKTAVRARGMETRTETVILKRLLQAPEDRVSCVCELNANRDRARTILRCFRNGL